MQAILYSQKVYTDFQNMCRNFKISSSLISTNNINPKIIPLNRSQFGGYNDIIYTKLLLVDSAMQAVIVFRPSLFWYFWQPQLSQHAKKL